MKKKILFVVDNLKMGGVTKVLVNLLKKLDYSKYEIDLLVLHYYADMKVDFPKEINIISGSKTFSFVDENISKLLKEKNLLKIFKKAMFAFVIKSGLIKGKIVKDRKENIKKEYDIEIAFGDGFPYLYTGYGETKKKIAWMHSDVLVKDYSARYYKQMKDVLSNMNLGVAVSEKVAESYKERYGVKNLEVIHNVMDEEEILRKSEIEEELPFDSEVLNFLSVGRLDYSKNYDMLLRVTKRLVDEGHKFKVYIIGDGEERDRLEGLIKESNMEDNFILLGRKDNPYPYVKNADLFLLSSRYEGLPTVIIEALILHVPCLSTEVAGINQILNDSIGVVSKNNEEDYYLKLKEILLDSKRISNMKENLSDYIYDNNSIIKKVEGILNR